jgi:hypothetical protein
MAYIKKLLLQRFTIRMATRELDALQELADLEIRDFREQARFLIIEALISRGLLDGKDYQVEETEEIA